MAAPDRKLVAAMAQRLSRGLSSQAAGSTAAGLSFRDFLASHRFCGLELSPAMLAIVDASEGVRPRAEERLVWSLFGCPADRLPMAPPRVVAIRAGGRAGKTSRLLAPKALHAAWTVPLPNLRRGEIARAVIIAPDKDLAGQVLSYARGYVAGSPEMRAAVVDGHGRTVDPDEEDDDIGTAERILLRRPLDGALVEVAVKAARRGGVGARARTLVFAGLDEASFFYSSDGYTVNDREIHRAAIQRIVPGGQEWIASTPWLAHEGLLEEFVDREWGRHEGALVAVAGTRTLNPAWDPDGSIERDLRRDDPENAAREIDAQPLAAGTEFMYHREGVRRALELHAPRREADALGAGGDLGFVSDASALALVGRWGSDAGSALFGLVAGEEKRPDAGQPLKPSAVIGAFADMLAPHGVEHLVVDGHSREAAREHAEVRGLALVDAPTSPVGPHLETKKLLDEGRLALGDVPEELRERLALQLGKVRKGKSPGGVVQVIMPRGKKGGGGVGHCDLAAALALAVWRASQAEEREEPDAARRMHVERRGGGDRLGSRR